MNRIEHLFCILGEEGAEVAQRTSKVQRFGLNEIQPGQMYNNSERLVQEISDLIAVAEMLEAEGLIDLSDISCQKKAKKVKVEKYLKYSREQGTLTG